MSALRRWLLARNVGVTGALILGYLEGKGDEGITFDDDCYSRRSVAYDRGRDLRRRGKP